MDVAMRPGPRVRTQSYLPSDDTGTDADGMVRRKFQRAITDPNEPNDAAFRKPSMPASAMRLQPEQYKNFSHRRKSTQVRDNVRVPSGPREFPSPGRRLGNSSISSLAPSMADSTHSVRTFLPHTISEPHISRPNEINRFSFGNPSLNDDNDSPTTPAERISDNFGFLPSVNFDDFQNSLMQHDDHNVLLSDFPTVSAGRVTPKETQGATNGRRGIGNVGHGRQASQAKDESSVKRSHSLRRRLSAVTGPISAGAQPSTEDNNTMAASHLSFRSRRQSSVPQAIPSSGPAPPPPAAGSRASRKSVGPGLLGMMDHRKSSQPLPVNWSDSNLNPALARTASLSRVTRRTTMQTSNNASNDGPRTSTLTATTQSRQNKTKSLLPPPRDHSLATPQIRPTSKGANLRATTPSSSGNKRQSTISGRASGLGARTISPTDTRRLRRLSMMQGPTMPDPPTPQDEMPAMKLDYSSVQPSPSLVLRKTNSSTPPSARASPEIRQTPSAISTLSSKPSLQSLNHSSSQSRLPTPKGRSVHSSSAQYGDGEEMVPPVPAIPKAYESPRDTDTVFFQHVASRSTQSTSTVHEQAYRDADTDPSFGSGSAQPAALTQSTNSSVEPRVKLSGEHVRTHRRTNTLENAGKQAQPNSGMTSSRPQPDPAGRKNNNLQPLRLPPLNLAPINVSNVSRGAVGPRPSQKGANRDDENFVQTPEPQHAPKTPSTPMTASKATFFRRHDDDFAKKANLRSSTSHFALRDLAQTNDAGPRYFDEIDTGLPGVSASVSAVSYRNAVTPFASGSLPKGSGEFARRMARPSGEHDDYSLGNYDGMQLQNAKPQGQRMDRSATVASFKTHEETSSIDSPGIESTSMEAKKESGGLRRRLSFGWRRSSKAVSSSELKSSPQQDASVSEKNTAKSQKRMSEMPPPALPASATWSGDIPALPHGGRPSIESTRRKSTAISGGSFSTAPIMAPDLEQAIPAPRGSNLRSDQPQPIATANRSSSWGNIGASLRPLSMRLLSSSNPPQPAQRASSISAIVKDKDDHAADEEMRRLSQKRRDVDTAARDSEELRARANARSPMSPEQVLHDRNCALNIFERGEVMDYEKDGVFFTGTKSARKIVGALGSASDKDAKSGNYGYDDERGDYNIVLGDHLAYRYEVVDVLGKGSFGQVVRCVDHRDGGVVAVKIIRNKKRFHQQALVEVGILGRLREWDPEGTHATLSITSSFYFRSHLCIVTPCLSINLYELIRAHNFGGFSFPLIRRFARQLLACLVLLQNKRIIHCDLKPENILLCEARKADVRVIDFGSSCKEEEKVYTYIQSRFYRSPEVILGSTYGLGIDMWSFGCILAELLTGYPIFPGENEQEQLACIMEIFGPPDRHLVERCTRKKLFFDSVGKPRVTVSSKGRRRRPSSKTLAQALKTDDEAFLDFITRCLRWDPDRRMKPHEAVNHPFITNQPFSLRPSVPEEARRAARLRASVVVPPTNGTLPSPVKRTQTTSGQVGTAFAQQAQHQTPAREGRRALPETPQTSLRSGAPPTSTSQQQRGSPSKQFAANKRQSTVVTAGAAAVAGSKRASNGLVIGTAAAGLRPPHLQQRQPSGSGPSANNLAAMAAKESMGTAANAARWRA